MKKKKPKIWDVSELEKKGNIAYLKTLLRTNLFNTSYDFYLARFTHESNVYKVDEKY